MILNIKEEKLGKSDAVYYLLLSMEENYSNYLINIWDIKGNNDTLELAPIKEIQFFEDVIVIVSKKGMGIFLNLNQVISIDLVKKPISPREIYPDHPEGVDR